MPISSDRYFYFVKQFYDSCYCIPYLSLPSVQDPIQYSLFPEDVDHLLSINLILILVSIAFRLTDQIDISEYIINLLADDAKDAHHEYLSHYAAFRNIKIGRDVPFYFEYAFHIFIIGFDAPRYYSQPISKTKYIYEDMSQYNEVCPFIIPLSLMVTSYKL